MTSLAGLTVSLVIGLIAPSGGHYEEQRHTDAADFLCYYLFVCKIAKKNKIIYNK